MSFFSSPEKEVTGRTLAWQCRGLPRSSKSQQQHLIQVRSYMYVLRVPIGQLGVSGSDTVMRCEAEHRRNDLEDAIQGSRAC